MMELLYENSALYPNRSNHRRCSVRKGVLRNFTKFTESTCARVSFLINLQAQPCNFIEKETLAQVLSCEFYKSFKNTWERLLLFYNYLSPKSSNIDVMNEIDVLYNHTMQSHGHEFTAHSELLDKKTLHRRKHLLC